jgi:tetratricopeptide (TPR) repeat protein
MTRRSASPSRCVLAGLVVLVLAAAPAGADRLHLDGGGRIDTPTWWLEGDWIYYEGPAGTVGIPRAMVVRIEETDEDAASASTATGTRTGPAPPTGGVASSRRGEAVEQVREAHAALREREFERASALYGEALRIAPDLTPARIGYAMSEMALGRDGLALSTVLDGLTAEPGNADLHELLGDLRNREERVEDALRSWKEAFRLRPNDRLRDKIFKAERELDAGRDYDFAATSHFNVRYDGEVDVHLATQVMDFLEDQYWDLSRAFHHAPPQPITVLLYPTREFRAVTQSGDGVGGIYDGKIRVPLGGLSRLDPRAQAVLKHELTHAVVHSKTRGHCPRWLHEGLAQIKEGRPFTRADQARVADILERVDDPSAWSTAGFSYPAALSLVRYLEGRRGFDGLVDLLETLGEGVELESALEEIYGADYATLCQRWAASAGEAPRR